MLSSTVMGTGTTKRKSGSDCMWWALAVQQRSRTICLYELMDRPAVALVRILVLASISKGGVFIPMSKVLNTV